MKSPFHNIYSFQGKSLWYEMIYVTSHSHSHSLSLVSKMMSWRWQGRKNHTYVFFAKEKADTVMFCKFFQYKEMWNDGFRWLKSIIRKWCLSWPHSSLSLAYHPSRGICTCKYSPIFQSVHGMHWRTALIIWLKTESRRINIHVR